ncbi:MAG: EAL domain-containing protein [Lachnospiraceae bacterium]|nr:EAL domain-containing protein [Candidatus Colinaster scatohippi]
MIFFEELPLDDNILEALAELQINYVFQPIFLPDGKTIYAREALMRPVGKTVVELIEEYTQRDELHVLEVATFWGATQAYVLRGYTEKLSINSFPCESFSEKETMTFVEYFGRDDNILIIESLEYPHFDLEKCLRKKKVAAVGDSQIALDDYGVGINNMEMVDIMEPHIIKIDRSLLSGIDHDDEKKKNCKSIINEMHSRGIKVVAEGVETKEEFDYLVSIGADLFQGYYLGRPN